MKDADGQLIWACVVCKLLKDLKFLVLFSKIFLLFLPYIPDVGYRACAVHV